MNGTRSKWIKRCIAIAAASIGLGGFALALAGGDRRAPPVHYDGPGSGTIEAGQQVQ